MTDKELLIRLRKLQQEVDSCCGSIIGKAINDIQKLSINRLQPVDLAKHIYPFIGANGDLKHISAMVAYRESYDCSLQQAARKIQQAWATYKLLNARS